MNTIMDQTELKKELKQQLLAGLEEQRSFSDAELYDRIDELLFAHPELCLRDKLYLRDAVFNSFVVSMCCPRYSITRMSRKS